MSWPIKEAGKLLSDPSMFAEHEGMQKHNNVQWEEDLDLEGSSVSQAVFGKGGYKFPPAFKRGDLQDDFKGPVFTKLTDEYFHDYSTPGAR